MKKTIIGIIAAVTVSGACANAVYAQLIDTDITITQSINFNEEEVTSKAPKVIKVKADKDELTKAGTSFTAYITVDSDNSFRIVHFSK